MKRYEFGYSWHHNREDTFTHAVARAARDMHVRCLRVAKGREDRVRADVDRRRVRIGLFLNTQADGLNMEGPGMLLCRVLKASGCHVVEDPDDARVYTQRALQMRYLARAGIPVPAHAVVVNRPDAENPRIPVGRSRLGTNWVARPARGMGRNRIVIRGARSVAAALARSKLKTCPRILVMRQHRPARLGEREYRFLVWHLFGRILPCWKRKGSSALEPVEAGETGIELISLLADVVSRIARITGLDWFFSEIVATRLGVELEYVVVEPANALALLGPGPKPASEVPLEVARAAAERIVEVAWRGSLGIPLSAGIEVCAAPLQ